MAAGAASGEAADVPGAGDGLMPAASGEIATPGAPAASAAPLPAAVADGAATMPAGALAGRTVLVTAGPTVEPIDAVRYISY